MKKTPALERDTPKSSNGSGADRRKFLMGLAVGAGIGPLAYTLGRPVKAVQAPSGTGDLCYAQAKPLLAASDFKYLGYYDVQLNGQSSSYAQALTHRYVNGELRFLSMQLGGWLGEFSITGRSFGQIISNPTNRWNNPSINGSFRGIWWDEQRKMLWSADAVDYNSTYRQGQIRARVLNADGTIGTAHGPVGLQGIPDRRLYGGIQPIPAWFQTQYGVGPYLVGWGGYTSLLTAAGGASLGPAIYAINDPLKYGSNTEMPTSAFKVIADCAAAAGKGDWYPAGSPSTYDRGVRITKPINYFDGGDTRPNPSTPPTTAPSSGGQWLSPAPDGLGRFVWGDSYYNTGLWIDGPNKHGFIAIASLGGGKVWYQSSDLHFDKREYELHIFDPLHFGEAIQGTRPVWKVRPSSMTPIQAAGLGPALNSTGFGVTGNVTPNNLAAATYDPVSGRLYVFGFGANDYFNRLYVYDVTA